VITVIWTSNLKGKEIWFIAVRMCLYWLGGVRRGFSWQFSVRETVLCYGSYSEPSVWFTVQSGELWYTANFRNWNIKFMHVFAVHFFVRVEVGYFFGRINFQDFPSSKNETILLFVQYKNKCVCVGFARCAHSKPNTSKAAKIWYFVSHLVSFYCK